MRTLRQPGRPGKKFPYNRAAIRPLGFARKLGAGALLGQLSHALKAATRSRNRLIHIAPSIFSSAAKVGEDPMEADRKWVREYVDMIETVMRERKELPEEPPKPALLPQATQPVIARTEVLPDEKETPLEGRAFQLLPAEKKKVIKHEFRAWRTWHNLASRHQETYERQNPLWQEEDSPGSAKLRELWSRYDQVLLGFASDSGSAFTEGDADAVEKKQQGFDHRRFQAEELAKYGPPPAGVSVIEHIVRASFAEDDLENPKTLPGEIPENR